MKPSHPLFGVRSPRHVDTLSPVAQSGHSLPVRLFFAALATGEQLAASGLVARKSGFAHGLFPQLHYASELKVLCYQSTVRVHAAQTELVDSVPTLT